MNNWKESYRKESWTQKVQDNKDRVLEARLRADIESAFEELAYAKNSLEEKRIILGIVRKYKAIKYECDYTEEDEKIHQEMIKKLEDIEYQIKKEKHDRDSDSKSWNEYREEEEKRDRKEERDI